MPTVEKIKDKYVLRITHLDRNIVDYTMTKEEMFKLYCQLEKEVYKIYDEN